MLRRPSSVVDVWVRVLLCCSLGDVFMSVGEFHGAGFRVSLLIASCACISIQLQVIDDKMTMSYTVRGDEIDVEALLMANAGWLGVGMCMNPSPSPSLSLSRQAKPNPGLSF